MTSPDESADDLIAQAISLLAPASVTELNPTMSLREDLGYYSLALIELAFTIEEMFDIDDQEPPSIEEVTTVEHIHRHVRSVFTTRGFVFGDGGRPWAEGVLDDLRT